MREGALMNDWHMMSWLDIGLRCLVSFVVLFLLARLMGKKQLAQLTFFDYVVGISIGSIAAAFAIDNEIPYAHGLIGLVLYALFPIVMSKLEMRSVKVKEWFDGTPTVLVQNGKFVESNLRKSKFNITDVLEECRMKGAFSVADVEFAVLETSGQVSVLLKSQKQPLTPDDLNISTQYKGLNAELIIDGIVIHENLRLVHLDQAWLKAALEKQNVHTFEEVLFASLGTDGKLTVDLKRETQEPLDVLE